MTSARDELQDDRGRLRREWRRMLGTLLGMGVAALQARAGELNRALAEEGAAAVMGAPRWRCDPVPFLLTETEFARLAGALAQRADVLEAVLRDVYGPMALLKCGLLPPALVFPSPFYLRPCRNVPEARHISLYAADLLRAPDGKWHVLADHTAEPAGLAHVLENRRMMARVLPDMFRSVQVAQIRPFFDAWQDSLQRLAPQDGSPGLVLLSPGHADRRWFEHVVLARELGCALMEDGDLTARDGAVWVKTLRGLTPVHVLLRYQTGTTLDPLELHEDASCGVPGLFAAMRAARVQILNGPGAGFAEAPALAPLLPALSRHLLGQDLLLPAVEAHWLGDADGLAHYRANPSAWRLRSAFRRAEQVTDFATGQEGEMVAQSLVPPSTVPCVVPGELLEPRGVTLRLFLLHDGAGWRPLPGGVARVAEGPPGSFALRTSKDVWVLEEEGADIMGPGNLSVPYMQIRRTSGDMPSRVADNFYWFGRYLERLENAARLIRTMIARVTRAGILPRDLAELQALTACLVEARLLSADVAAGTGPGVLIDMLRRSLAQEGGQVGWLTAQVQRLADHLRDRLSGEMHGMIAHGGRGLKGARLALMSNRPGAQALQPGLGTGLLADFAGRVLEFSAAVSGYAAENMVRGGGRLFLDLGRRIERAYAISGQLGHALDVPPERVEAGLGLALELCDSVLTYRSRYLSVLQPAPVLDLILADEGNPRGLIFQLMSACTTLAELAGEDDSPLALMLTAAIRQTRAVVADVTDAGDQAEAASGVPDRLKRIKADIAALSDATGRQYFTLLPVTWAESVM